MLTVYQWRGQGKEGVEKNKLGIITRTWICSVLVLHCADNGVLHPDSFVDTCALLTITEKFPIYTSQVKRNEVWGNNTWSLSTKIFIRWYRCNVFYFQTPKPLPWYRFTRQKRYALHWYQLLHLWPDNSAINPVLCLLRNMTPHLFPVQDINSVYLASKPLLNSCPRFLYWIRTFSLISLTSSNMSLVLANLRKSFRDSYTVLLHW